MSKVVNVSQGTLVLDTQPRDGWGNILPEIHIYLVRKGKNRKFFGKYACECTHSAELCFQSAALSIGVVSSRVH